MLATDYWLLTTDHQRKEAGFAVSRSRPVRRDAGNWVEVGSRWGKRLYGEIREKLLLHRVLKARPPVQPLAQAAAAIQITQHGFGQ